MLLLTSTLFAAALTPLASAVTGTECLLVHDIGKCYACPPEWHTKKECSALNDKKHKGVTGWKPTKYKKSSQSQCGFLNAGCKGVCYYEGMDYGCGCGQGQACLNVDCVMSDWSDWSKCKNPATGAIISYDADSPIVNGIRERTRTVLTEAEHEGEKCGNTGEEMSCSSHQCELFEWEDWSDCSKSCGYGEQTRVRKVTLAPLPSECKYQETRTCKIENCYYIRYKGQTGNEIIDLTSGSRTYRSTPKELKQFSVNKEILTINFINGGGNNDSKLLRFYWAKTPSGTQTSGSISHEKWEDWECDTAREDNRCDQVRNGYFHWGGIYTIEFEPAAGGCSDC